MTLNERLTMNYQNEIKDYLKFLSTKGYIIANDSVNGDYVARYSVHKSGFFKVCEINQYFENLIRPNVHDYYQINLDGGFLKDSLYECLAYIPSDELNAFTSYEKYESDLINESDLKTEIKDLKRIVKSVKVDKDNFMDSQNQVNLLVSNFVLFTGNTKDIGTIYDVNSYFKYEKKKFIRLNSDDIHKILVDGFKINPNTISVKDVEYHMRNTYRELFSPSTLPIRYNKNVTANEKMKEFKKKYLKVKKVIDEFI